MGAYIWGFVIISFLNFCPGASVRPTELTASFATEAFLKHNSTPAFGNPQPHDAVMGMCSYSNMVATCKGFVNSLRWTGFDGSIVLGVTETPSQQDKAWLAHQGVTKKIVKCVPCATEELRDRGMCSAENPLEPVALARFRIYKKWLSEGGYDGYILISDTRDVFFQTYPFTHLKAKTDLSRPVIEVATEWGWDSPEDRAADTRMTGSTIAESGFTRGWIQDCLGEDAWKPIKDSKVLCSGTILGTPSGMATYLTHMDEEISKIGTKYIGLGCQHDQGFHNYVTHSLLGLSLTKERREQVNALKNTSHAVKTVDLEVFAPAHGDGDVLTLGMVCTIPPTKRSSYEAEGRNNFDEKLVRDENGFLLMMDSSRAPIVHQYDRCPDVEAWVGRAF